MKPEQWQQARELFASTRSLPKEVREAHLHENCNDPVVLKQVNTLLEHDRDDDFLDQPALGDSFTLADSTQPQSGMQVPEKLIEGYKITHILGSGASGIVYGAEQFHPKRNVAIKVLRAGAMGNDDRSRFHREAQTLASFTHPNIATIFAAGETQDGSPWMSMELATGSRLDEWAENATLVEIVEMFATISEAIEVPHQASIVHRDLKPANIVVSKNNEAKILDFGVARVLHDQESVTQTGAVIGTRKFMSPEQASGSDSVDARSDVYALGVMLEDFLQAHAPRDVITIAKKACDEFPSRRYATAGELCDDLRRFQKNEPVKARRSSAVYHTNLWIKRHKFISTLLLLVVFTGIFSAIQMNRVKDEIDLKEQIAYAGSIQEAQLFLDKGDLASTKRALDSCIEDFRGWEWHWINQQLSVGQLPVLARNVSAASQEKILGVVDGHEVMNLQDSSIYHPKNVLSKQTILSRDCSTLLQLQSNDTIAISNMGQPTPRFILSLESSWKDVAAMQLGDDGRLFLIAISPAFDPDNFSTFNAPTRILLVDSISKKILLDEQLQGRILDANAAIAMNIEGTVIAAANVRGNVTIWRSKDGEIFDRRQIKVGHGTSLLSIDNTGRYLAVALLGQSASNVRLLTVDTLKTDENLPIVSHDRAITSIDISPNGKTVASIDTGGRLRITPLDGGLSIAEAVQDADQGAIVKFSNDSKWVLIVDEQDTVNIRPASSQKEETRITAEQINNIEVDNNQISFFLSDSILVYNFDTRTVLKQNKQTPTVHSKNVIEHGLDISEDELSCVTQSDAFVACGTNSGGIHVWNKLQQIDVPIERTLSKGVESISISRDNLRVAASSVGNIVMFDITSGIPLLTLRWNLAYIQYIGWLDDGNTLFAISMDGRLRAWSISNQN